MSLRKAIHQFFLHVANLFYEEEKEVLVMGELTKKLRYQKTNGVTGAITLYSTAAEAGDNHLNLQVDNVNAYAALGEVSDANASHLRIQKGNTTYAVLSQRGAVIEPMTFTVDHSVHVWNDDDNCYVGEIVQEVNIPSGATIKCTIDKPSDHNQYFNNSNIGVKLPELTNNMKYIISVYSAGWLDGPWGRHDDDCYACGYIDCDISVVVPLSYEEWEANMEKWDSDGFEYDEEAGTCSKVIKLARSSFWRATPHKTESYDTISFTIS